MCSMFSSKKLIVFYGGSFSPIHNSHQKVIENIIEQLPGATVCVVPVDDKYNKKDLLVGTGNNGIPHRVNLCQLVIDDIKQKKSQAKVFISSKRFDGLSDQDISDQLRKDFPDHQLCIVYGQDVFDKSKDKGVKKITESGTHVIVHSRDDDVSSTKIRENILSNNYIDMNPKVIEYLKKIYNK